MTETYALDTKYGRFTFDEANHIYRLDEKILRNNTAVLENVGITNYKSIPEEYLEFARVRGSAAHSAIRHFENGTLERYEWHPIILEYLEGYKKFKRETDYRAVLTEQAMFSYIWRYATTLDTAGYMRALSNKFALIEIKTGTGQVPSAKIQVAGQSMALIEFRAFIPGGVIPEMNIGDFENYVLEIKPNDYKLHECEDVMSNIQVFTSALWLDWWKNENLKGDNHASNFAAA